MKSGKKKSGKKKIDFKHVNIPQGIAQIPYAFKILLDTPLFIKNHKLWKGFLDHTWVLLFSIFIAILFTNILYDDLHHYFFPSDKEGAIEINIDTTGESSEDLVKNIEEVIEDEMEVDNNELEILEPDFLNKDEVSEEKKHNSVFSGSLKFLLLILLEIIIFHFSVKTNNILKKENKLLEFNDFYKAEIRLIKIMGRNWLLGILMYVLVSVVCGITGTKYLSDTIMFCIYGFYLGFAFLDNYLEQFNFDINKSTKTIQKHFGAATVIGIFSSITMNIPIIGPLLVPFICGIAATRYGHAAKMEDFVFEETVS